MMQAELRRYWPPEGQRLLLEAAVAPPDAARAAWRRWATDNRIEDATWFEARLFASLAPRLAQLIGTAEIPARLQGLRRYVWVRTQQTLIGAAPLLAAFHAAGIRMMPLKGAARHASAGADQPSRCLTDIDLLIHPADWDAAIRTAYATGWTYVNGPMGEGLSADEFLRVAAPFHHSFCFKKGDVEVDLHHLALFMSRNAGDDQALWQRAGQGRLSGVPVAVPSPSDQLFITLAHALLYGPEPSGDWMLDAAALIGSGAIDWEIIEREALRRRLEPSLVVPLAFLAETTPLPIPEAMLQRLTSGLREPFVADFIAHAVGYRPVSPVDVDASRDAAGLRALGSVGLAEQPVARLARRRLLLDARPTLRADGNMDWFAVPADLPVDAATRIVLDFRVGRGASAGRPIAFDVVAPGMTLKRWSSRGQPIRWWQNRRLRLAFDLPAALFRQRGIEWFGLQLPDADGYPRPPIRDIRVRWWETGRLPKG